MISKTLMAAALAASVTVAAAASAQTHGAGDQSKSADMMKEIHSGVMMGMHPGMMMGMHPGMMMMPMGQGMMMGMHPGTMMMPMGQGMMMGMHPGVMMMPMRSGPMMAPGKKGQGMGKMNRTSASMSADDVKSNVERWLSWHGNPRLTLGEVAERDDDTIVADITTQDGTLVDRFEVDRHSGAMHRIK